MQTDALVIEAQMESHRIFEETKMKSKFYQENHARDCLEIEELRRICREETEKVRQLRTDELYGLKKEELSMDSQFLSQIWTLQDKVNFMIRKQRAATFPVSPREFRVPEVCFAAILHCRIVYGTRWILQETFLQVYLLKKGYLRRYPVIQRRIWQIRITKVYQELP